MRCERVTRFQEGTGAPTARGGNAPVLTTNVLTQLPCQLEKKVLSSSCQATKERVVLRLGEIKIVNTTPKASLPASLTHFL